MKLYIGDKLVNFSNKELEERYINEGREGKVYEYNNLAIKIYSDYFKYRKMLTEEDIIKMKKIKTDRFLLPKETIFNEKKELVGCATDFKIEAPKTRIGLLNMKEFLEETKKIKQDIYILSENHIRLEDLNRGSLLMTQSNIFITDPGAFEFSKSSDIEPIIKYNINQINRFFIDMVLNEYLKLTKNEKQLLKEHYKVDDYIFDEMLKQDINPKQKVGAYYKSLVKKI